jgi:repressor LexA
MKTWLPFNANEYVRVKLTDLGLRLLREKHGAFRAQHPKFIREFVPPAVDEEGYSKFQLWALMQDLGEHVGLGKALPFDCNILFGVNEKAEPA